MRKLAGPKMTVLRDIHGAAWRITSGAPSFHGPSWEVWIDRGLTDDHPDFGCPNFVGSLAGAEAYRNRWLERVNSGMTYPTPPKF